MDSGNEAEKFFTIFFGFLLMQKGIRPSNSFAVVVLLLMRERVNLYGLPCGLLVFSLPFPGFRLKEIIHYVSVWFWVFPLADSIILLLLLLFV